MKKLLGAILCLSVLTSQSASHATPSDECLAAINTEITYYTEYRHLTAAETVLAAAGIYLGSVITAIGVKDLVVGASKKQILLELALGLGALAGGSYDFYRDFKSYGVLSAEIKARKENLALQIRQNENLRRTLGCDKT